MKSKYSLLATKKNSKTVKLIYRYTGEPEQIYITNNSCIKKQLVEDLEREEEDNAKELTDN